jgi:hypothetical protein
LELSQALVEGMATSFPLKNMSDEQQRLLLKMINAESLFDPVHIDLSLPNGEQVEILFNPIMTIINSCVSQSADQLKRDFVPGGKAINPVKEDKIVLNLLDYPKTFADENVELKKIIIGYLVTSRFALKDSFFDEESIKLANILKQVLWFGKLEHFKKHPKIGEKPMTQKNRITIFEHLNRELSVDKLHVRIM